MQIVIPMTGQGSRFIAAGYKDYKPFIEILGKPVIAYLVSMFDPEDQIDVLIREDLLEQPQTQTIFNNLHPNLTLHPCKAHKKGPVYTVAQHYDILAKDQGILVTYCDYYMHWDYTNFKKQVALHNYDGAIPSYTGYHPHLMTPDNVYANCKVNKNMLLEEIKEKHSYSQDKTKDFHSAGAYYYKNKEVVKHYFDSLMHNGPALNGEYYASLVYQQMLSDGLQIWVDKNISHFCQWGTPEDMEECIYWLDNVSNNANDEKENKAYLYWKFFLQYENII